MEQKPTRRALPLPDFCASYGIGRTTAYAEMAAGRLLSIKVGRRRLIPTDSAEKWLESFEASNTKLAA